MRPFLLACLVLASNVLSAQGIENVVVETYAVTPGKTATDPALTTYRIYVDLAPGYRLQMVYGDKMHQLKINTTTEFFNDTEHGDNFGNRINADRLNTWPLALDSWLTIGAASDRHMGVPRELDTDGSVLECPPYAEANTLKPSATQHPLKPLCIVDAGNQLGEGPCWSADEQALYWVDILARQLQRFDPATGTVQRWSFEQEVSAVAERRAAPGLLVSLRHGFAVFDPRNAAAGPRWIAEPEATLAGNRFNDGKCDAAGRFWAGSMDFDCVAPSGVLYRLDSGGGCSRHADGIAVINGPTWSADGRTLYLCDSARGLVYAHDFDAANGTLSNRRTWLQLATDDGQPDGLCTDAAGRIWLAHWAGSCITCHDPVSAAELARVHLPVSQVTSCAFGGADLQTLYVTSARVGLSEVQLAREPLAGGLFSLRVSTPGLPAQRFAG
jgi:sugar lactone lactonase YvrE